MVSFNGENYFIANTSPFKFWIITKTKVLVGLIVGIHFLVGYGDTNLYMDVL
jgi:hypothetical protein